MRGAVAVGSRYNRAGRPVSVPGIATGCALIALVSAPAGTGTFLLLLFILYQSAVEQITRLNFSPLF